MLHPASETGSLKTLRITGRQELAGPATLLSLEPEDGEPFPGWEPGQYLTFRFEVERRSQMRSYSIASAGGTLSILVKKVDNGIISRYLVNRAQLGSRLLAYPPKGSFTIRPDWNGKPLVLLAAGSGIAPIYALATGAASLLPGSHVLVHHAARTISELYFHHELEALQASGRIDYNTYISSWGRRITPGILQQAILSALGRPAPACIFMLCGPYVWMRSLRMTLAFLGVPADHIRLEQFAAPAAPARSIAQSFSGPCQAELIVAGKQQPFLIHHGQTILEAAEAEGLNLPYSCRGGVCGSCAVRLMAGKVEMRYNEILSPHDLASGLCLTCTALPTSPSLTFTL